MPRAYMATILSSKPVKRRSCLGMSSGSKLPSRSRGTSMRSGPSSVSTVLPLVPLRWLVASSGLARAGRVAQVVADSSAPSARSISAFLNAIDAALTASRAHRAGDELVNQFLGNRRQRRHWRPRPPSSSSCLAYMLLGRHAMPRTQNS